MERETTAQAIPTDSPVQIAMFRVGGRAVPWKAADVESRGSHFVGVKNRSLAAWQEFVKGEARKEWGDRGPYGGSVGLSFWFYIHPPGNRRRDEWCLARRTPDLSNLVKAAEDALKGVILVDDRSVCAIHSERYFVPRGEPERVWIQVWATPGGGLVEPEDPGPYAYRPWAWVDRDARIV